MAWGNTREGNTHDWNGERKRDAIRSQVGELVSGKAIYGASQVVLVLRNPPTNTGEARDPRDTGLIPGSGRSPGGGHGNPSQFSCLKNPMDREPGRLQSIGLQRVRHNWIDLAYMHEDWIAVLCCVVYTQGAELRKISQDGGEAGLAPESGASLHIAPQGP